MASELSNERALWERDKEMSWAEKRRGTIHSRNGVRTQWAEGADREERLGLGGETKKKEGWR
jgi:hypothetical protein